LCQNYSLKTQGALDGRLKDKPQLQLPLVGQQEFFEFTGVLFSPHLFEDIMTTLLKEDGMF